MPAILSVPMASTKVSADGPFTPCLNEARPLGLHPRGVMSAAYKGLPGFLFDRKHTTLLVLLHSEDSKGVSSPKGLEIGNGPEKERQKEGSDSSDPL